VTLVAPTGANIDSTIKAIYYSTRNIEFAAVKLITHKIPEGETKNIEVVDSVWPMDTYLKYNQYVFEELYNHVETSHCLLIQYDGFVVQPELWDNNFLNYDYIGAPWPYSETAYVTDSGEHVRVGNGGFSLRSKKLLELPKKYNIPFQEREGFWNEDGNVCVYNRESFRLHNIKYAPIDVAVKFSKETVIPENENVNSFGFHNFNGHNSHYRGIIR
jgi:hypothetical protein